MKPIHATLSLYVTLLIVGAAPGQAKLPASSKVADQLYLEAVGLHLNEKYADALSRMKKAVALAPKNQRFQDYEKDLSQRIALQALYQHALKAPAEVETSVEKLAAYLIQPAKSDEDKARLLFRWVADRIAYDVEALRSKKPDDSIASVLQNRKAVCGGYCQLYEALGKAAGLETIVIVGQSKTIGISGSHSWNAVKVDGAWRLSDVTWAAGVTNDKGFTKRFHEANFQVPAEEFIFAHFPKDPQWQLLAKPVTVEEFQRWPTVRGKLFQLGFKPADLRAAFASNPKQLVMPADLEKPGPRIQVLMAPLEAPLKSGQKYRFRLDAPGFQEIAVFNGGAPTFLTRVNGVFEAEVTAKAGRLNVSGKWLNQTGSSFDQILTYGVE